MNRQLRRGLADLRHRDRDKRLQKLLAAKTQTPKFEHDSSSAIVVNPARGFCTVMETETERLVRCDMQVAPGDEVSIRHEKVASIAPRRTSLARTDPGNPHRKLIVAANIDLLIIVATLVDPPFRPGLVDRYILAANREGIQPVLCLNKSDLGGDICAADMFTIPKLRCSAATGDGIDDLRLLIAGNTTVLAGHSGPGKSSLLNALTGEALASTGEVARATGKGRHTTTSGRLYLLANGGRIIDTAGIREFGLDKVTRAELDEVFPEFSAAKCRFSDCRHRGDTGCSIADASGARYERWLRLQE